MEKRIFAPADGEIIELENITDEVFSSGIMGEGFGVLPSNGKIYSPVSGIIESIHRAKHAYSISSDGLDVLVHIGIDTVELDGECFESLVKIGDRVECGDKIASADIDKILEKGFDPVVVVIVSSEGKIENVKVKVGECKSSDSVMTFDVKENPKAQISL